MVTPEAPRQRMTMLPEMVVTDEPGLPFMARQDGLHDRHMQARRSVPIMEFMIL